MICSTVTFNSLSINRRLPFKRFFPIISPPTPNSAITTSHPKLLPRFCRKQLLQPRHRLPILQQQSDETPPTLSPAHAQRNTHRQPKYRHARTKSSFLNVPRHDAATGLPSLVVESQGNLRTLLFAFPTVVLAHLYVSYSGLTTFT